MIKLMLLSLFSPPLLMCRTRPRKNPVSRFCIRAPNILSLRMRGLGRRLTSGTLTLTSTWQQLKNRKSSRLKTHKLITSNCHRAQRMSRHHSKINMIAHSHLCSWMTKVPSFESMLALTNRRE